MPARRPLFLPIPPLLRSGLRVTQGVECCMCIEPAHALFWVAARGCARVAGRGTDAEPVWWVHGAVTSGAWGGRYFGGAALTPG